MPAFMKVLLITHIQKSETLIRKYFFEGKFKHTLLHFDSIYCFTVMDSNDANLFSFISD